MEYLLPVDYEKLIYKVISHQLEAQQTSNLFYSEFLTHKAHNPNFEFELEIVINELESKRKTIISKHQKPDFTEHIEIELANGFIPFSMIFGFLEFGEYVSEYDENVIISNDSLNSLKKGFQMFRDKPLQITEEELEEEIESTTKKIKWNGGPSDFGFLINQLIANGWIEKPYKSYNDNAKFFLNLFDIDTTVGTLAKELSEKSYSLSPNNEKMIRISHIDKMRK